ncbi:hypothetical protein EHP00_672 [Ecytonucleospora hepatopenaei]|uniref:General transcription and DNA repair factor IIH subunit TFB5 n=1 Tax=Ecytonucleospora hepatopenaei TaxID=646526 RepID=A0A1W0E8U6_9MICR|nr:hypothetical protein EHP00_672 [Ecytonucleospora hepatopenaei]
MVTIKKCVLIKTEPSIKEVISGIAEKHNFLIQDVDDNHIFITEKGSKDIKRKVKHVLDHLTKSDKNVE